MPYFIDGYVLDAERRELRKADILQSVEPQVFDLLEYLIANRDRVVSRNEMFAAIWKGRIVSDSTLSSRINAARAALGDTGEKQRLIRTLLRKGVRFVGDVRETDGLATATLASAQVEGTPVIATDRASIVVLPFHNLSDDPKQEYFVDGVTESLTTDLSRIMGLRVIARNTAFTYKGQAIGVQKLGRELNARYVLEGSVQRAGDRLRVNVQLIDAETGNHLWAERFDKLIADLFDMQDEIVSSLANALNAQLIVAEARRAERSPHPDAMDLTFQGQAYLYMGTNPEHVHKARDFFERALAIDHRSVGALLGIATVDMWMVATLLTDDQTEFASAAEANVLKALSLAPDHAVAHAALGGVYIFTNRATRGIAEFEHALLLDRNLAYAHGDIGLAKYFLGQSGETEGHILQAFRLSPRDLRAYLWMHFVGIAKMQLGADAEAVAWLRRSIEANRNLPFLHFELAAALGLLGAIDEARTVAKAALALSPSYTIRRLRTHKFSDNLTYLAGRERICEGMRLAGVPEG